MHVQLTKVGADISSGSEQDSGVQLCDRELLPQSVIRSETGLGEVVHGFREVLALFDLHDHSVSSAVFAFEEILGARLAARYPC